MRNSSKVDYVSDRRILYIFNSSTIRNRVYLQCLQSKHLNSTPKIKKEATCRKTERRPKTPHFRTFAFQTKKPLLLTAMDNDGIERLETIMKPTKKHRGVLLFIYFLTVSLQAVVGMQLYRLAESYNVQVLVCHFTRRRHSVRSIPGRLVV